ncbi:autotransporter outer membrane beta-barrel domain-containing protein, partial [Xenophilus aerolatus]|nr:autotransporter outer membrane beta-barrel domain-containing protein [Xenophilus aerolatus]
MATPETSRRRGRAGGAALPLAALALALPALGLAQTTLNPGDTLYVTNPSAQVTGDLIINGGTLRGGVTLPNNVQLNGNFVIDPLDPNGTPSSPEYGMTWAGNVSLANTPTISFQMPPSSVTYLLRISGAVSGNSGLTIESNEPAPEWGDVDFVGTASNTYTGLTTVRGNAVLALRRTGGATSIAGDLLVEGTATVGVEQSEQIADTSTVTVNSAGGIKQGFAAPLPGLLFYAPGLTETIGTLNGNGTIGLGSSTLAVGAGDFGGVISDPSVTHPTTGIASGSGGKLVKYGPGTLTLGGANTYSGGTTLNAGTLMANNDSALGTGALTVNGGTLGTGLAATTLANAVVANGSFDLLTTAPGSASLTLNGNVALNGPVRINGASLGQSTFGFGGAISGGQGLTFDATGGGANTFNLFGSASNSYAGPTTVQGRATLMLSKSGGATAIPGDLTVSGTASTLVAGSEQIADGATVTVNSTGQAAPLAGTVVPVEGFALYSSAAPVTETIGALQGSGSVGLGAGTLRVGAGDFTGSISDGASAAALSGANLVGGKLEKYGPGTLKLSGANRYTGATTVSGGTLQAGAANTFAPASAYAVASGATLDLAGHSQTIASMANSGTVSLLGSAPGTTLTVNGPWVGNGGLLSLGTALGDSASVSDRLVLNGPSAVASGTTNVQVTNLGGLGALTTGNGIEVISATNGATTTAQTTKSAFSLVGGHVDAGAFEYRLHAADASGAGENWYLRSSTTATPPVDGGGTPSTPAVTVPTYRAEVPLYAALPEQFRQANWAMLGNMHQRIGDESGGVVGAAGPNKGNERQAWGRVISMDRDIQQSGTVSPTSKGRLTGFQAGTDLWANANWRTGVYVGQLEGDMSVTGFARGVVSYAAGSNDLRSQYLGAYATWKNDSGLYVDGVLQAGRHRYTTSP